MEPIDPANVSPKVKGIAEFALRQDLTTDEAGQLTGVMLGIAMAIDMGVPNESIMQTLEEM